VKSYVDPEIIRSVLVSNSKQYEEETLINNLVTSGAQSLVASLMVARIIL
jgi:hypothetical protein